MAIHLEFTQNITPIIQNNATILCKSPLVGNMTRQGASSFSGSLCALISYLSFFFITFHSQVNRESHTKWLHIY